VPGSRHFSPISYQRAINTNFLQQWEWHQKFFYNIFCAKNVDLTFSFLATFQLMSRRNGDEIGL
jgi:hypothetical protein